MGTTHRMYPISEATSLIEQPFSFNNSSTLAVFPSGVTTRTVVCSAPFTRNWASVKWSVFDNDKVADFPVCCCPWAGLHPNAVKNAVRTMDLTTDMAATAFLQSIRPPFFFLHQH